MSPERVIPGQVVPADSADGEPSRPQETFLHKVASGPFGAVPRTRTDDDGGADAEADTEVFTVSGAATARAADADEVDPAEADLPDADLPDADLPDAGVRVVDAVVVEAAEPATAEPAAAEPATAEPATADADTVDEDATHADATHADTVEADATEATGAGADMAGAVTQPATDTPAVQTRDGEVSDRDEPLLGEAAGRIREEWRQVQASFVYDPRASVAAAAGVTADVAARLESLLRERQRALRGTDGRADTETLRQLMLAYRKLLTKLIS
jgi:hypothetical protein